MGFSHEYSDVPDWVEKPKGYQTDDMVKYKGNIFKANFWASKPGEGDANENGWRLYDELYDVTSSAAAGPAKIIGYIPTWRKSEGFDYAEEEMYLNITHGIVSFLMFDRNSLGDFESKSVDDVDAVLEDIVDTGHRCGTKISIALGGATDYGFLNLMERVGSNPGDSVLGKAVKNVADFIKANDLDGVDLDLECWWDENNDASKDQGGRSKSDGPHPAGKGLTIFARELKKALPGKIVSTALFATSWYGNCYDPGLADYVDWIGVMTYDLTGSWNQSPVGPQTSLLKIREQEAYADEQQGKWPNSRKDKDGDDPMFNNPVLSVEDSLWYWTNPFFTNWQGEGQGIKRSKMVPGVPIYGYDFAHGKEPDDLSGQIAPGYKAVRYKDILKQFPSAATAKDANIKVGGSTPRPPFVSESGSYPYAHNIYFETPETATNKLNFLKKVGTQGVIIWELTNDVWEGGSSIVKALYKNSGNPPKQAKPKEPDKEDPDKDESDDSDRPLKEMLGVFPEAWLEGGQQSETRQLASRDVSDFYLRDTKVGNTSGSPALATYKGKLYCVHEGRKNDGWLWYCSFDGAKWSEDKKLPDHGTSGPPAIAEYKGKLYCVHEEQGRGGWLWFCSFDGKEWSKDKKLPDHGTGTKKDRFPRAALAVYGDLLYCVHEGQRDVSDGWGWLWYCTFDGEKWSKDKRLPDHGTSGGAGLAVAFGALYCFHEGQDGQGILWSTKFEDGKWDKDTKMRSNSNLKRSGTRASDSYYDTTGSPGMIAYGSKIYLVHEGRGASGEVRTFNSSDLQDRRVMEARPPVQVVMGTSRPPAIANYNGTFFIAREDRGNSGDLLVASSSVVDEPSGEFNLEMPERPGAPYDALDRYNTALTNHQPFRDLRHPVEVMRHHIIPDRLLNRFWNALLENGALNLTAGGLLRGLEESAENNRMNLNQADRREVVQLLQGIRSGRIRHNPSARRPLGFDTLAAVYEWMPGNLFIGPRGGGGEYQRTDDPGEGFEENARVVVGAAFANMEIANGLMRDFERTGNARTGAQAVAALTRITQRKQPYDIDSSNWIFKGGKYRLRKPGD